MDIFTIAGVLIIPLLGFLWKIYSFISVKNALLKERISDAENKLVIISGKIDALENQQEKLEVKFDTLDSRIDAINLKIERILTILEKQ
ncbi:hypothetical protein GKQ23_12990 [Erwinia sp. E602]|uniref:hypothetical protein n=1 Tax=Erwinia sp. E602 TaxID=2675378 RepID=UPI001BA84BCF|nr:hypothetical protein [Erwinia sp. E602]QUG75854.1 hypothetical protein GKQ23_12990 [Erwinia sp. E602]